MLAEGYTAQQISYFQNIAFHLEDMRGDLTNGQIFRLAHRIYPLMRANKKDPQGALQISVGRPQKGKKFWVKSGRIAYGSFAKAPKVLGCAAGLRQIGEVTTYHKLVCEKSFCPTMFEVLYQIPKELRDKTVAFELYALAETPEQSVCTELNSYRLRCILYTGKVPKKVLDEPMQW